jgi:hypothetical protein
MSTENQEPVTVEAAAEEKTETKDVKGTKRAAEVSILGHLNYLLRKKVVVLQQNKQSGQTCE